MADLTNVDRELSDRIRGMQNEAGQRGIVVVVTTGYRSLPEQQRLFDAMIAAQKQFGRNWQQHAALAAVPGTSHHGTNPATAVDLACASPTQDNIKIHGDLAVQWGLTRTVASEYWHLELDPDRKPLSAPQGTSQGEDDMPGPQGQVDACSCSQGGWWVLTRDGGVRAEGGAPFFGSYPGLPQDQRQGDRFFIRIEERKDKPGYYLFGSDDTRYAFG